MKLYLSDQLVRQRRRKAWICAAIAAAYVALVAALEYAIALTSGVGAARP